MTIWQKIGWRLRLFVETLPLAACALFLEPGKQPWGLVFARFGCGSATYAEKKRDYVDRFRTRWLQDSGELVVYDFGSLKFGVPPREAAALALAYLYFDLVYPCRVRFPLPPLMVEGPYEWGPVRLRPGDVVVDAGAGIGMFTIQAARKVGARGRVYAFEPDDRVRRLLFMSLALNGDPANVVVVPAALGPACGSLRLSVGELGSSSGAIRRGTEYALVDQVTLDEFVARRGFTRLDFLTMDIEGMERDALAGARETIRRFRPKLAICTYHLPDDPVVIPRTALQANPDYRFIRKSMKVYGWCPGNARGDDCG